jgi:hypothetical protein
MESGTADPSPDPAAPAEKAPRRPGTRHLGALAAILAVLVFSGSAHAEFVSSDKLFDWLTEASRIGGSFKDSTISLGFVVAVHDVLPVGEVCLPAKANARQMQLDVLKWMKDHRSRWDPVGARTTRQALLETYPCPGEPAR